MSLHMRNTTSNNKKTKPTCRNLSFTLQAQVVANQTLDEQQQDHTAVHDRNGEQVEDTQLQTDERDQHEELREPRAVGFT